MKRTRLSTAEPTFKLSAGWASITTTRPLEGITWFESSLSRANFQSPLFLLQTRTKTTDAMFEIFVLSLRIDMTFVSGVVVLEEGFISPWVRTLYFFPLERSKLRRGTCPNFRVFVSLSNGFLHLIIYKGIFPVVWTLLHNETVGWIWNHWTKLEPEQTVGCKRGSFLFSSSPVMWVLPKMPTPHSETSINFFSPSRRPMCSIPSKTSTWS